MATLAIQRVVHRFREPLPTAFGALTERVTLTVALTGADGVTGLGEAAPLEPYDGVSLEAVEAALARYAAVIAPLDDGPALLAACQDAVDLPQALAAIDLALWDRAGKREGRPVAELLADHPSTTVPVNATIGALEPAAAADAAAAAVAAGFRCVKVKVGAGDDVARIAGVRAGGGPELAIRVDANGAWTVEEAAAILPRLDQAAGGLELCEEPVHGTDRFAALSALLPDLRLAADESGLEAAAVTCLKIGRAGGISGLCAHAAFVQARGGEVYLASTFDGPLGIAAALHCAAALDIELPCGLATLNAFAEPIPSELAAASGAIPLPAGPGLVG